MLKIPLLASKSMGPFGKAAYECLIDRVNRTIEKGDEDAIRNLKDELWDKIAICDSFEWEHIAMRVGYAIYMIDCHLGETYVQEEEGT